MWGNMSFVRTGRIGQWDDNKLGSGSYVRIGRRTTWHSSGREVRKNTDPNSCVGCADEQTSASVLPNLSSQQGEGVQNVFIL